MTTYSETHQLMTKDNVRIAIETAASAIAAHKVASFLYIFVSSYEY